MTNQEKFYLCLKEAQRRVEATKAAFGGVDILAFKVGGGVSNTDSAFSRQGTSDNNVNWTLPAALSSLITQSMGATTPASGLTGAASMRLSDLLTRDTAQMPGRETLDSNRSIVPDVFPGSATLGHVAAIDPTTSDYESDTLTAFQQRAADAMGQVQSGHPAVRGGQNRSAMAQGVLAERLAQERGNELRSARVADSGIVAQAVNVLNSLEAQRRGLQLTAQQNLALQTAGRDVMGLDASRAVDSQQGTNLASLTNAGQFLGQKNNKVTDDLTGKGSQGTSSFGGEAGLSCCWIFLEHYHGEMPSFVRLCRDVLVTPRTRRGYRRTALALVPLMRRFSIVRRLVLRFMVGPITKYGGWLTCTPGYDDGECHGRVLERWMKFWNFIGV